MGLSTAPSISGLQFLNLADNTFGTPIPAVNQISEGIQTDPCRNLILSADEQSVYDLFQTSSTSVAEFADTIAGSLTFDSAAEDCTTGIALATVEGADTVYITDLSQAIFTPGSPTGTWTAPAQLLSFPEFSTFSEGVAGISVVPNAHLAIITSESGGNAFGALVLPFTSGSGTPAIGDYVAATLPNTPDTHTFEQGSEPHTITAYISPSNGKAYGIMSNGFNVAPTYLAVIDIQALLIAPRTTGTHNVDPTYDLIANGVVRYVSVN
jgi:hypothetical protein